MRGDWMGMMKEREMSIWWCCGVSWASLVVVEVVGECGLGMHRLRFSISAYHDLNTHIRACLKFVLLYRLVECQGIGTAD